MRISDWSSDVCSSDLFVDFNQNAPHKTVFGAWSVRPRVGAQVSTPITWDELDDVVPDELTIATVPARVAAGAAPWTAKVERPPAPTPLLQPSPTTMADALCDRPGPRIYPTHPNQPPRGPRRTAQAEAPATQAPGHP